MKIFNPVFLLTTTALVTPTLAAQHDKVGHRQLQQRDLVDDIHNAFNDFFNVGHAGDNTDTTTATTKESQDTSSKDAGDNKSTPSDKPTTSKESDKSTSESTDKSSDNNSTPSATDNSSSTQSSPSPTSSGEKCSGSGKRCKSPQDPSYQQCMDGVWVDISCNGDSVCGKNSDGQVACMGKDQATMTYEHCSKKGETKCSQDPSTYQQCNGKYWETQKCGKGTCFMDNGKAQCGNGQGGGDNSYVLNTPGVYVPPSGATRNLVTGSSILAAVVGLLGL